MKTETLNSINLLSITNKILELNIKTKGK